MGKSNVRPIQEKIGEWSLITAAVSGAVLSLTGLIVAILWSIKTFTSNPPLVISAWSGGVLILSLTTFGVLLWIDRNEEEDLEEDAE